MVTLPEALNYSSWKSCSLKKVLWWECAKRKLLALDRVCPLPGWAGDGRLLGCRPAGSSTHSFTAKSRKRNRKKRDEVSMATGLFTFFWLLSQILPSKQATDVGNNIWVWWAFISDTPRGKVLRWSPRKWHKLISGQNIKYKHPASKHWAWSSSSLMFPNCIEFLDFMYFFVMVVESKRSGVTSHQVFWKNGKNFGFNILEQWRKSRNQSHVISSCYHWCWSAEQVILYSFMMYSRATGGSTSNASSVCLVSLSLLFRYQNTA